MESKTSCQCLISASPLRLYVSRMTWAVAWIGSSALRECSPLITAKYANASISRR
ncbi:MAG TPA: hypothetical protein PL077_09950 [Treponemataceae bacterium]|nr:hypothetical protein [Treponemataceae bacterium]